LLGSLLNTLLKNVIMVSSTYALSRDIPDNTMIKDENEEASILEKVISTIYLLGQHQYLV